MTENKSTIVYIGLDVPDAACESIMSTAIEGGIGYWSQAEKIVYANHELTGPQSPGSTESDRDILYWSYDLSPTYEVGSDDVTITPTSTPNEIFEAGNALEVNYDVIRLGIKRLFDIATNADMWLTARKNFLIDYGEWACGYLYTTNVLGGDQIFGGQMDANDCDMVVQLGLFGDTVYS